MKRRDAFTLVELLVVIAIIAVLAAVLFPVLARAREAARDSRCKSNLGQLARALTMYANDYDGMLPGYYGLYTQAPPDNGAMGVVESGRIFSYVSDVNVYICPSDKRGDIGHEFTYSYTVNAYICGMSGENAGQIWGYTGTREMPITDFLDPARTPAFVDEMNEADGDANMFLNDYAFIWLDVVTRRHFGHGNVAFLDGHVEQVEELAEWRSYMRKDEPDKLYFQYPLKFGEVAPWY